jgi:hypothetical protein
LIAAWPIFGAFVAWHACNGIYPDRALLISDQAYHQRRGATEIAANIAKLPELLRKP